MTESKKRKLGDLMVSVGPGPLEPTAKDIGECKGSAAEEFNSGETTVSTEGITVIFHSRSYFYPFTEIVADAARRHIQWMKNEVIGC